MKKHAIFALTAFALLLTACGGGDNPIASSTVSGEQGSSTSAPVSSVTSASSIEASLTSNTTSSSGGSVSSSVTSSTTSSGSGATSSTPTPDSSTTGEDPVPPPTPIELGILEGLFYESGIRLEITPQGASLYDETIGEFTIPLDIIEVKSETMTKVEDTEEEPVSIEYTTDVVYMKDELESEYKAYIEPGTSTFLSFEIREDSSKPWEQYAWLDPYVPEISGAWTSTAETAGFVNPFYFSPDIVDAGSIAYQEVKVGSDDFVYIPYFMYDFDVKTGKYDMNSVRYAIDIMDPEEGDLYFTYSLRVAETSRPYDAEVAFTLFDESYGEEYLYPTPHFYEGEWYAETGGFDISFDTDSGKVTYDSVEYTPKMVYSADYGWSLQLKTDVKTVDICPAYDYIYIDDGTSELEAIVADYENIVGDWYLDGVHYIFDSVTDPDSLEVTYSLTVNGTPITEFEFCAKNRRFGFSFSYNSADYVITAYRSSIAACLYVDNNIAGIVANFAFYEIFVGGFFYSDWAFGPEQDPDSDVPAGSAINFAQVNDNMTGSFDSKAMTVDFIWMERYGTIGVRLTEANIVGVATPETHDIVMIDEVVYGITIGNGMYPFVSVEYLEMFDGGFTHYGPEAQIQVSFEHFTVTMDGSTSGMWFYYSPYDGFMIIFQTESALMGLELSLPSRTLIAGPVYYGDATRSNYALNENDINTYIDIRAYKRIAGTYVLDGPFGPEVVIIGEDGKVQITNATYDDDGVMIGVELVEYGEDEINFQYFIYGEGEDAIVSFVLVFNTGTMNLYAYKEADGFTFEFFSGAVVYVDEMVYNEYGFYVGDNDAFLDIHSKEVNYNGEAGVVTGYSYEEASDTTRVYFDIDGVTFIASFYSDGSVQVTCQSTEPTVAEQYPTLILNKTEFNLADFYGEFESGDVTAEFGVVYDSNGSAYIGLQVGSNIITDYTVQIIDGKVTVVFVDDFTTYSIAMDGETLVFSVVDTTPLPPPPPPLPPAPPVL